MHISQYEIEVIVNGKPVAEYLHQGKTFIEGKESTEFALRLRNRTGKRALFVPTIDGLSVMDGKEASFESSGYIIGAYSTETINGWRTSDDEVAKFFFSKVAESYAAATGKDGNVGVIGCAIFKEKEREPEPIRIKEYIPMPYPVYPQPCYPHWPHNHTYLCQAGGQAGSLSAGNMSATSASNTITMSASNTSASLTTSMQTSGLGTGFGDAKYEPVRTVKFEHEKDPAAVIALHYNTRANLEAMGVEFKRPLIASASPFPKESGYCEPPKGWTR